jgi:hypothetical protein
MSETTPCPHSSLHGVPLENSHAWDARRSNGIGPDLWECDGCLTILVEDSVVVLDSNHRDLRAVNAELLEALAGMLVSDNDTHRESDDRWTVFRQKAHAAIAKALGQEATYAP